ncbi:MAG: hypothetical protein JRG80_13700 [Deltaproteobacteria bacterium]|nr:hypothetical protein [Deltaproteobacteria bacterium]MBW2666121.1 hypothetical protein [Deltaproteobacteria bacterium]
MRLIAVIEDLIVARKILEWLKLPARAPPLVPAAVDTSLKSPPLWLHQS